MKISFSIPGEPIGKGRPKFARRGNFVQTYTPEKTASYENLVKLCYRQVPESEYAFAERPIQVNILAKFSISKSASKKKRLEMLGGTIRPTKKPDVDNLVKSILDALSGVAYKDDSQVVELTIGKIYSENPLTIVTIEDL